MEGNRQLLVGNCRWLGGRRAIRMGTPMCSFVSFIGGFWCGWVVNGVEVGFGKSPQYWALCANSPSARNPLPPFQRKLRCIDCASAIGAITPARAATSKVLRGRGRACLVSVLHGSSRSPLCQCWRIGLASQFVHRTFANWE